MVTKRRKTPLRIGDIVQIDLGDGWFGFGRVLVEPLMAFYDIRSKSTLPLEEIISTKILFQIWVANHAVTSGRWPVVGNVKFEVGISSPPLFFKKDPISKRLYLHSDNGNDIPATKEQCEGLEYAAIWDPRHVEDRLRDHFEGIPNKWVESFLRVLSD